jgi:hypothetical protein
MLIRIMINENINSPVAKRQPEPVEKNHEDSEPRTDEDRCWRQCLRSEAGLQAGSRLLQQVQLIWFTAFRAVF